MGKGGEARADWTQQQPSKAQPAAAPAWVKPLAYGLLNIVSASGIVFANKAVFTTFGFKFTTTLTLIHTVFTMLGMRLCLAAGMFEGKQLPAVKLTPLALAYVAYIVLCNLSLNINTVGFYQVMKIAVAPTVLAIEAFVYGRRPEPRVVASIILVCAGIAVATVTDSAIMTNVLGMCVGVAATLVTALYQIWAGTKQKELRASSMQLLAGYTPQAALFLVLLLPLMDPIGLKDHALGTLLGYQYTAAAVGAILISAALGLLVSLSTFLVIGATSSLTYNVVGHCKTIIILAGGCIWFHDEMPPKKLLGVSIAMLGIIWYTQLKLKASAQQLPPKLPLQSPSATNGKDTHVHLARVASGNGKAAGLDDAEVLVGQPADIVTAFVVKSGAGVGATQRHSPRRGKPNVQ